jgi:23S rRNA (adenine2503-C2)-methyltransferase
MPSISTIAPHGTDEFFEELLSIKNEKYSGGNFQFQFSLHTTDQETRDEIIPVKKWSFDKMAAYGERFYKEGDRKVTLNFALANDTPLDPQILRSHFDPDKFLVKITPLNPTYRAEDHGLTSYIDPNNGNGDYQIVSALETAGYQVIVSIGEVEENLIGSNCGQYILKHLKATEKLSEGYTFSIER